MEAKRVDEVAHLLEGDDFQEWHFRLEEARRRVKRSSNRHEELLTQINLLDFRAELLHRKAIDTLERANVLEDESAALQNEAAKLENESFEVVARFEDQRTRTTEAWQRMGALDFQIEEADDKAVRDKWERQKPKAKKEYDAEDAKKQKLWVEVERLWVRSLGHGLELHEKRLKAGIVRAEAEELFARHDQEKDQSVDLRKDSEEVGRELEGYEREVHVIQEEARDIFGCLLHEDFLYWIAAEDNTYVYATPLVSDTEHYRVELKPGRLYRCPHESGVDALERVTSTSQIEGAANADDAKVDDAKADDAKVDDAKAEDAKAEDAKADDAKADDDRADDAKADDAKVDDDRADDAKADDAKVDDAKADDAKVDDAKADDAKVDDAKAEDAKADDAKVDDAKADDAKADDAKADDAKAGAKKVKVKVERKPKKAKKGKKKGGAAKTPPALPPEAMDDS